MKPAVMAPLYVAIYPELAELLRQHGYALSIHGSLAKDFDLVAIPWAEMVSGPADVIAAIEREFAMRSLVSTVKNHGRLCYTIIVGQGSCYLDLSFVNEMRVANPNDPGETMQRCPQTGGNDANSHCQQE